MKIGVKQLVDQAMNEIETLDLAQARAALDDPDTQIVDLRDIRELQRDGKIPGAFHAPRGMLEFWVDPDSEYHRDLFSSGKRFVFYCAKGHRSALATQQVQRMGLAPVCHIGGGFEAWTQAGLPVEKVEKNSEGHRSDPISATVSSAVQPPDYRDQISVAGVPVTIRTLWPEDRAIEEAFVRELSPASRYLRFHSALPALTPEMAERFVHLDYPDQMALIACVPDGENERQIAVARWARPKGDDAADLGIAVADAWQGKGLGTALLQRLLDIAEQAGIEQLAADVLYENHRMRALARDFGFHLAPRQDDPHTLLLIRGTSKKG